MESIRCQFCPPPADRVVATNDLSVAIREGYPVSPGHTLVIPKRHVASLADVTRDEAAVLWSLFAEARAQLDAELRADGDNPDVNDGKYGRCKLA